MRAVAIENNKGGVGKTLVTVLLAAALARRDLQVLCVDMDPQANLSRRLGFHDNPNDPQPTLAEAIKADRTGVAEDVLQPCLWDDPIASHIDLLPSRFDLEARVSEAGTVGANQRLANVLTGLVDDYDYVLIDCPPSLGHLTQMSMVAVGQLGRSGQPQSSGAAGGYVLIVVEPEYDAMLGAVRTRDFVTQYAARMGVPDLSVMGVVVNRVRPTDLHTASLDQITAEFGSLVWEPHIPLRASLADAMTSAVSLSALGRSNTQDLTARFDALAERMEHLQ